MTKKELIRSTARNTDFTMDEINTILDALIDEIKQELARGGQITINQFGKFYLKKYPGRKITTPQGKTVKTNASMIPGFKAGRIFKKYINGIP